MSQRRLDKLNSLISGTVSEILLKKSKDPRLVQVTVTRAVVSPDLKKARIFYSVFGDDEQKKGATLALNKAKSFVRALLGENLSLKHVPEINFEYDKNLEYAQHISEVLATLTPLEEKNLGEPKEEI
jgi:ribosome-binding factor A